MKRKILSLVLALAMLCGMFSIDAVADENYKFISSDLQNAVQDYMFIAEFCDGYFEEGGSPSAGAIMQNSIWMMGYGDYEGYKVWEDEYGFAKYEIPADVYESKLVFTYYAKTDAIIDRLHSADFYKTDKDEPYYLVETGGGFGGPLPTPVVQSYTLRDDGLYEIYALLVETILVDEEYNDYTYVPTEDEVEGEDYLVIWDEIYTYDEGTDTVNTSYGFVYAKITSGLKAVIDVNMGSGYAGIYHAFHKIDKNDIPEGDVTAPEEEPDYANVGGSNMVAFVEIDRDVFEPGVTFFGEEYMNDEEASDDMFDTTAELLKDDGVLAGVYEFTAEKDGTAVQPGGKIVTKFLLPNTFSPDCTVYYINEDGVAEVLDTAIETTMDEETGTAYGIMAVAELEHFSRYAVAGTLFGDSDGDGQVNIMDVSAILKSIAKWDVELNTLAIDANRDGNVNLADVTLVLKYIAGWDVRFGTDYKPETSETPEPEPEPEPTPDIPETPGMEIDGNGVLVKYTGTDTEVVIPDGVTAIGDEAFRNCTEITKVVIPDSVKSIGDEAFALCNSLTDIEIPNSVTHIGESVFYKCRNLEAIAIPDSVTTVSEDMFDTCTSLNSVTIPDSVTSIERYAFYGCENLSSIKLPDGLTNIGEYAFSGAGLGSITIPDGVTDIGEGAFGFCNLSNVTIPAGVKNIGVKAFNGCGDLTGIDVAEGNTAYKSVDGVLFSADGATLVQYPCGKGESEYTVPDGVTSIGDCAFVNYKALTKIVFSDDMTSVGESAFSGCTNLTDVTIDGNELSIGKYAFSGCTGITDITIPDGVVSIGEFAFSNCTSLVNLTLSDSVTSIGPSAFSRCAGLKDITIPSSVTNIGVRAFGSCTGIESVTVAEDNTAYKSVDGVLYTADGTTLVMYPCGKTQSEYTVPDGVTAVCVQAFAFNTALTSVTLPVGLSDIDAGAFYECRNLAHINIPDSVTSIGEYVFQGCVNLLQITLPEGITSIEEQTFSSCESLTEIVIPDGVTSIGSYAFNRCRKIESVTIPDSVTSIGDHAFSGCNSITQLTLPKGLTKIENAAFSSIGITEITIPDSVTEIGESAFGGCTDLTQVTLPKGITTIPNRVFANTGFTEFTIPESVTSIGDSAFEDCDDLVEMVIPDNVTSIGSMAFYDCDALERITLPSGLKTLEHGLFLGCNMLTEVTVPDGVESISTHVFASCVRLEKVTVPASVTSIGNTAFGDSQKVVVWCPEGSFADEYTLKNKITSHPYSE